jgi:C4-dicarboxylate-specific signal transduction histidine kinase
MEGSDGKLTISAGAASSDGRPGAAVEIEDSGPGVRVELREQIFNPFFTSKPNGVGLGLAIVAKILDDHHGSIRLKTDSPKGACFRVFLPAASEVSGD